MNIRSVNIEEDLETKGEKKKRFSPQEKLLILSEINKETTMDIVAEKYNLAVGTLKRWMKKRKTAMNKEDPLGLGGLSDSSTKPKNFSNRLPKTTEEKILSCWQERPGLGPSQIHYQLKREGIKASTKAIRRYGKSENLLTDKGMQFYSWRTMGRFQKLLKSLDIEHILARAHHPQTLGKVEALNKRIQNELIEKKNFRTQLEVEKNIRAWVHHYNHNRTHQGIRDAELGTILVPADRYYGREEEVLAKVRGKLEGKKVTPFDYTTEIENLNPFEILKVAENKGRLDVW